jgi:hypothetical protein
MPASSLVKKLSTGERIFKSLNGVFCIYKPPDMDLLEIHKKIKFKLVNGINELPCRPIKKIVKFDEITSEPYVENDYADSVEGL